MRIAQATPDDEDQDRFISEDASEAFCIVKIQSSDPNMRIDRLSAQITEKIKHLHERQTRRLSFIEDHLPVIAKLCAQIDSERPLLRFSAHLCRAICFPFYVLLTLWP